MSCIVLVEKKQVVTRTNDLHPVALTFRVMKVFDNVVLFNLQAQVVAFMDPFQFAYQKKGSVDDAILHVLNNTYLYPDKARDIYLPDVLWFFVHLQYCPAAHPCRQINRL